MRPPPASMITATAPKDSQNPAEITAMGSTTITSAAAAASTASGRVIQPSHSAAATIPSMNTVR